MDNIKYYTVCVYIYIYIYIYKMLLSSVILFLPYFIIQPREMDYFF